MKLFLNLNPNLLALVAMLIVMPGCSQSPPQSQVKLPPAAASSPASPLSKGHELFLTHCVSCHQGAGNPSGPNAVILDSETLRSPAEFTALLRQPRSAMMTPFDPAVLPEGDVKALYHYLLSAKTPSAPETPQ